MLLSPSFPLSTIFTAMNNLAHLPMAFLPTVYMFCTVGIFLSDKDNVSKYSESFSTTTEVSDAFTSDTGTTTSVPNVDLPIAAAVKKSSTRVGIANLFLNILPGMQTACQKRKSLTYSQLISNPTHRISQFLRNLSF